MKQRLNNIELLRILSMLMVVTLHLLSFGGMLNEFNTFSYKAICIWLIESLCFVAVNCYVIISGYFLVDSKFKFSKIINIWIETLFYSVIIYAILVLINKIEFSYSAFFKSIFPFSLKNYWFVTVYITLYILSPFVNKLIKSLTKQQYKYLIFLIIVFFSLWATIISPTETINYGGSYSISWFVCLYIIAGYLKRFYSDKIIKKRTCLAIYLSLSFVNVFSYFVIKFLDIKFIRPDFLYNYYSISVLSAAISLFLLFKNLKIENNIFNKVICFFAPTTFAIYLIHENPNIRGVIWNNFYFVKEEPIIKMLLLIISVPIILFIAMGLIDKIRIILFKVIGKLRGNKPKISLKIIEKLEDILCLK